MKMRHYAEVPSEKNIYEGYLKAHKSGDFSEA